MPHNPSRHPLADQIAPPMDVGGMLRLVWAGKWRLLTAMGLALVITGFYAFHVVSPRYAATATIMVQSESDPTGASLTGAAARIMGAAIMTDVIATHDLLSDPTLNRYLTPTAPFSPDSLRRRLRHLIAGTSDAPPTTAAIHDKTIANLQAATGVTCRAETSLCDVTIHSGDPAKAVMLANAIAAAFVTAETAAANDAASAAENWLLAQLNRLQTELAIQDTAVNGLIAAAQMQDSAAINALGAQVLRIEESLRTAQTQAAVSQMTAQRDRLRAQLVAQSEGLMQLQQLQRDADTTRALHAGVLEELNATRLANGLRLPPASIAQGARQAQYVGPQKLLLLQAATLVGAVVGLAWVGWHHTTGDRVQDSNTLTRATGLPVLASMPRLRPGRWHKRRERTATEALRAIKAQLLLAGDGICPKLICCTADQPSRTGLLMITQLATTLGADGQHVLLIMPETGKRPKAGLAEVVAGRVTADQVISRLCGIDVMGMGGADHQDPAMMAGFNATVSALGADYDHILIAAPPVAKDPAALLWAKAADATLFLVSWPAARLSDVTWALQQIAATGRPATGLILTDMPRRALRRGIGRGVPFAAQVPTTAPA